MNEYSNLIVSVKPNGRSYEFRGHELTSPWKLIDTESGNMYDTYDDYLIEQEQLKKKAKFKDNMAKGKEKAAKKKADSKQKVEA